VLISNQNNDVSSNSSCIKDAIPGNATTYKSTIMHRNEVINYSTEFLNSLNLPWAPPKILKLKIRVPFFCETSTNPQLYNRTKFTGINIMNNIIETLILNRHLIGKNVVLPKISMIPAYLDFNFKRFLFSIRLLFVMIINPAQK